VSSAALLACALACGTLAACRSGAGPGPERAAAPDGPEARSWYEGTELMQAQLADLVRRIPETSGRERIELGRRIVSYGEPAVPVLVRSLGDADADVRGTAAWLLGFLGDPRSAGALQVATDDPAPLVRYEAGAALLRMGDARGFAPLVAGLEDADVRSRSRCLIVLQERTGETFDYRPNDPPEERAAAVGRWRAWVASRAGGRP
jgi:hypothetical protein